ncbi:ferrous iron transport protein A [Candidatus Bathyarchaeota archaeon]|nr:ferrous iron transport protein A [Candidatus Bathyarchaeota archaeon]
MIRRRRRGLNKKKVSVDANGLSVLTELAEGEKAVIVRASGGFGLVRRLAEMGLTPGVEIKLIRKCPFNGPVEIEVRSVTLALGCGVASRILVKPLKDEPHD